MGLEIWDSQPHSSDLQRKGLTVELITNNQWFANHICIMKSTEGTQTKIFGRLNWKINEHTKRVKDSERSSYLLPCISSIGSSWHIFQNTRLNTDKLNSWVLWAILARLEKISWESSISSQLVGGLEAWSRTCNWHLNKNKQAMSEWMWTDLYWTELHWMTPSWCQRSGWCGCQMYFISRHGS